MNDIIGILIAIGLTAGVVFSDSAEKTIVIQEQTVVETETETIAETETETETIAETETETETIAETETDKAAEVVYTDAETIKRVQTLLNELGYSCGTADGAAGNRTHSAMQEFQKAEGLEVSEKITDTFLQALEKKRAESEKKNGTEFSVSPHKIQDFPLIYQEPELPTGCEITAMTMVLRYYGYSVDKVDLAMNYLPRTELTCYTGSDGRLMGPDMDHYFVGNPAGEGIICGSPAVETAANKYLESVDGKHTAKAIQGISTEEIFRYISEDTPVVIWCTIGMGDREETQGWYNSDGKYMEWAYNDHGAVLIGYDEETVSIADPIRGMITCSRSQFEKIFTARGRQCVVLQSKKTDRIITRRKKPANRIITRRKKSVNRIITRRNRPVNRIIKRRSGSTLNS